MESLEFVGFSLDPAAMSLRNRQQEFRLRPKSFDLLIHLLRNRGRVLANDELLGAVWPDVTVSEESLVQCGSDIRRTLGPAAEGLIRTVSGCGYMIDDVRVRIARLSPHHAAPEPQRRIRRSLSWSPSPT